MIASRWSAGSGLGLVLRRGCGGGGKGGFGRAAAGRFTGAVAASQRLPCGARSRGPVAKLAARPAAASLKQSRRVRCGCALRARPQALRSSAPQRRAPPQPARTRLCSRGVGTRRTLQSNRCQIASNFELRMATGTRVPEAETLHPPSAIRHPPPSTQHFALTPRHPGWIRGKRCPLRAHSVAARSADPRSARAARLKN